MGHCGELTQKHTANPVHNHFLFEGAVCQGFSEVREKITDLKILGRGGENSLATDVGVIVASGRQKAHRQYFAKRCLHYGVLNCSSSQ